MEKRLLFLLVNLFLLCGGALAQTKVTGTVVSQEDGEPVIGASVVVAGAHVQVPSPILTVTSLWRYLLVRNL